MPFKPAWKLAATRQTAVWQGGEFYRKNGAQGTREGKLRKKMRK